jgi:hypothetical protein
VVGIFDVLAQENMGITKINRMLSLVLWSTTGYESFKVVLYDQSAYIPNDYTIFESPYNHERGLATLIGIMELLSNYPNLPNAVIAVDGIDNDAWLSSSCSFWRYPGDEKTLLWPDHDYFGRIDTWLYPHPVIDLKMRQEMIPIKQRLHQVFWQGGIKNAFDSGHIRSQFEACAIKYPSRFVVRNVDWSELRNSHSDSELTSNGKRFKPIVGDNRNLLRYKFIIYLWGTSWSTALKRMMISGGILIMPNPNPYESYFSWVLGKCVNCYMEFNQTLRGSELCEYLSTLISSKSDEELQVMADNLLEFTRIHFSLQPTLKYMAHVVHALAKHTSGHVPSRAVLKEHYFKVNCSWIEKQYLSLASDRVFASTVWQFYEFYNRSTCSLRLTSSSLDYLAI